MDEKQKANQVLDNAIALIAEGKEEIFSEKIKNDLLSAIMAIENIQADL